MIVMQSTASLVTELLPFSRKNRTFSLEITFCALFLTGSSKTEFADAIPAIPARVCSGTGCLTEQD